MKRKAGLSFAAVLLFCLLAPTAMWAQADDQHSLGDVARQKSSVKARRVITNDEIPPSPEANNVPSPSATSTEEGAPAASGASQPASKDAKPASSSGQQTKLQQLTTDHERLLRVIKDLEGKIAGTTDQQRKTTLNEVLKHAKDSLQENERQADKLKAAGAAAAHQPAASPSAVPPASPK